VTTFDDFDAWGDTVSGASLRMACDAIDTGVWTIGMLDLGGVGLQVASEGGGNLCYGGNTHAGTMLFVPLTHAHEHVVNGEALDDDSLFAIPRGADFRIRLRRRSHEWCSIALPFDVAALGDSGSSSTRIACPAGSVPRLRRLVSATMGALLDVPGGSAAHLAAGRDLTAAALACLSAEPPTVQRMGRPRLDRAEIVRRAMARIDAGTVLPTATELAQHVGVTGRTLLRAFQETFGVPPKRYLLLRELHAVRRSLRDGGSHADMVADVLARHGVWGFGRFASRYKRHFGESPSQTLSVAGG